MSNKSRNLISAETNLIRKFLEQRLELGTSHEDIIQQLGISQATYYRHLQRIQRQDAEKWEKVYLDSAKYRAVQLLTDLQNCRNLCLKTATDEKERSTDRIEAYKTAAEASANIYKLVAEGPVFRVTVKQSKLPFDNNQESINNSNNNKQLPN
jgi:hypothetical protein